MSKATDYVRKWINQEELRIRTKNAESALFGEKLKTAPEPKLTLSETEKMRIDIEVNRRMQNSLRADKRDYMKSEQEIKNEVLELFKRGEL